MSLIWFAIWFSRLLAVRIGRVAAIAAIALVLIGVVGLAVAVPQAGLPPVGLRSQQAVMERRASSCAARWA